VGGPGPDVKRCSRCHEAKEPSDFQRNKCMPDGLQNQCRACQNASTKRSNSRRSMTWFGEVFERPLTYNGARLRIVRREAIAAYGGRCECCGETRLEFLAFDHINGGGNQERKRTTEPPFARLRREGYPKGAFRILCHSCNMALGLYGSCPHQGPRETVGASYIVRYRSRIRREALSQYGGHCACCGEDRYDFLAFDHINGGGAKHRRQIHGNIEIWLRRNGWPPGFRVLCHNCNMALGFYGRCPHSSKDQAAGA